MSGITSISARQVLANVTTDSTTTGSDATIQNTYIPNGIVRLTNVSLMSVGGIPAAVGGQFVTIENQTTNTIFINNNDSGASVGNRIFTGTGANIAMNANATITFLYDAVVGMWMIAGGAGSGGGGGGSKNYLTPYVASTSSGVANSGNGNFELGSVTGWSTFTTTLTGVIPTGTISAGASGITTFAVVSGGTQLSGNYSLNTTAGTAFTAGQGFISNPFFIDSSDQAKVLGFSFDYAVQAGSGNLNFSGTSSNTFAVYIYDVTNAVWIQPAGVYNLVQNRGVGNCNGTFQTSSNSTQYQLAVLAINTSSGPADIYWDDFFVGPQVGVNAPAMSDWTPYSVVVTGSVTNPTFGTTTVNNAQWRQVGDSMEIEWQFFQSTAGTGGSGDYLVSLPPGYSIDTSKLVPDGSLQSAVCGTCQLSLPPGTVGVGEVQASDSQHLALVILYASTTTFDDSGPWTANNFTFAAPDLAVSFTARVPIAGWSSNSVASNDTDTRVVSASYGLAGTIPIGASATLITFDTQNFDTHGAYSTSTGLYTVPVSGIYDVDFKLNDADTFGLAGEAYAIYLYKNGSQYQEVGIYVYTGSGSLSENFRALGSTSVECVAGDTLAFYALTNSGAGSATGGVLLNFFSISRQSGPAVITATDTVGCKAALSTNSSAVASSPVIFDQVIFDKTGSYNPSTGIFTAPISGLYLVTATIQANLTVSGDTGILVSTTGGNWFIGDLLTASSNNIAGGSDHFQLNAGDQVSIQLNSTQNIDGGQNSTHFSIVRVGN